MPAARSKVVRSSLAKAPTGIQGLDEVTGGGLPKGRVTLVCGSAGCGKSLFAMEFLVVSQPPSHGDRVTAPAAERGS